MVTLATEMAVPGCTFLLSMGGAARAIHVQHDILQRVAVMKAVDPFAAQVGKRGPVLGKGQCRGLKPSVRGRGRLRIDSARPRPGA